MRIAVLGATLGMVLLLVPHSVSACSYPPPPPFKTVLENAESVAVVFVEEARARDREPRREVFFDDFVAEIRVVENLLGSAMAARTIGYSAGWCGGFEIIVGRYYVLIAQSAAVELRLQPGHPTLLKLFNEYSEMDTSTGSRSRLLMELRNFARIGDFLPTFPIEEYVSNAEWERAPVR